MMKRRKWIAAAMSAVMVVGLAACGNGATVSQTPDKAETAVTAEPDEDTTETGVADASAYVGGMDNASIDAATYLDYSAGIAAGVYRWIPRLQFSGRKGWTNMGNYGKLRKRWEVTFQWRISR